MAGCRTHTFAREAPEVFDAVLAAADQMGLGVAQADPAGGQLYLKQARRLGGGPRRFEVSVTDSGLGTTVVHVSWPSGRPLGADGSRAARLCRLTERVLAG